jgi:hypothetical protein
MFETEFGKLGTSVVDNDYTAQEGESRDSLSLVIITVCLSGIRTYHEPRQVWVRG